MTACTPEEILERLISQRPYFHGTQAAPASWPIDRFVMDWLAGNLRPGQRTLETGSGYSTVIFAAAGTSHQAISPIAEHHGRIKDWCSGQGVDASGVEFIAAKSQDVLPNLPSKTLDLVLIDGAHAFPFPFIDFYYTAVRLTSGGVLIVDDIDIITGRILCDFLSAETGRWREIGRSGKSAIFEKLTDELIVPGDWPSQPYCKLRRGRLDRIKRFFRLGR